MTKTDNTATRQPTPANDGIPGAGDGQEGDYFLVNGLRLYYEIHGESHGTDRPLVSRHGSSPTQNTGRLATGHAGGFPGCAYAVGRVMARELTRPRTGQAMTEVSSEGDFCQ